MAAAKISATSVGKKLTFKLNDINAVIGTRKNSTITENTKNILTTALKSRSVLLLTQTESLDTRFNDLDKINP